jgi:hypothetical protein
MEPAGRALIVAPKKENTGRRPKSDVRHCFRELQALRFAPL